MSKKKSIICTIFFTFVIYFMIIGTIFIRNAYGKSLFDAITASITGLWLSERVRDFYNWLRKGV